MLYWRFSLEKDDVSKEKHPEVRICQSPSSALSTCLWCSLQPQHAAASSISGETLLSKSFHRLRLVFACHNISFSKAGVLWVGETFSAGQPEVAGVRRAAWQGPLLAAASEAEVSTELTALSGDWCPGKGHGTINIKTLLIPDLASCGGCASLAHILCSQ